MDLKYLTIGVFILFLFVFFSGCEEQASTTEKTFENIEFESDVVEIESANLKFVKDDEDFGGVRSVELNYRLHNPLERDVTVVVDVMFFDENDREIYSKVDFKINLPSGYTEKNYNTITYNGAMVRVIDHVKITAYEQDE